MKMACPLKEKCEYYKPTSVACEVDYKRAHCPDYESQSGFMLDLIDHFMAMYRLQNKFDEGKTGRPSEFEPPLVGFFIL